MITTALTLLLCAAITSTPEEFAEVNDIPAPSTAPCDEEIRYQQLRAIEESQQVAAESEWAEEYQQWYESDYVPQYQDYDVSGYYAPSNDALSADYGVTAAEFQWRGIVEDGEHFYTWYSERVLPGGGLSELNSNGRHSEDGFVKDGDGFIAVASCDYEKGTVIETPFGAAKVYDTGYLQPGQIDVYTSF